MSFVSGNDSMKEIGVRLAMEGFQRDRGGAWYPSLVVSLLASATRDRDA